MLTLCQDFYNSIHPFGITKKESVTKGGVNRSAHHKKVKQWFLYPSKYCQEIEMEQKKHPDKCIFHLSKSHPTEVFNVKKECDHLLAAKKSNSSSITPQVTTYNLRHITEDCFEDAVETDT